MLACFLVSTVTHITVVVEIETEVDKVEFARNDLGVSDNEKGTHLAEDVDQLLTRQLILRSAGTIPTLTGTSLTMILVRGSFPARMRSGSTLFSGGIAWRLFACSLRLPQAGSREGGLKAERWRALACMSIWLRRLWSAAGSFILLPRAERCEGPSWLAKY